MSEWRRKASEILPDLQRTISEAWSPMSLWIELMLEFEKAHQAGYTDKLDRILKYARWCWGAPSQDTVAAVLCAFFEHLPVNKNMRADIPHWFSLSEFERLRGVFSYHAGNEVVSDIEHEYGRVRANRRPR